MHIHKKNYLLETQIKNDNVASFLDPVLLTIESDLQNNHRHRTLHVKNCFFYADRMFFILFSFVDIFIFVIEIIIALSRFAKNKKKKKHSVKWRAESRIPSFSSSGTSLKLEGQERLALQSSCIQKADGPKRNYEVVA